MQKNGDDTAILTGYSDVDWEGNINDHKCSFGYLFVMIEQQSAGRVGNRLEWHYIELKQTMLPELVQHKMLPG